MYYNFSNVSRIVNFNIQELYCFRLFTIGAFLCLQEHIKKRNNNSAASSRTSKNNTNPSNLSSYEFEYRENKHPEYQYISDDNRNKLLTNKITTRKDRSEIRRERHREEDDKRHCNDNDKFHIGLLFGCLVLSYLLNFAYGFQGYDEAYAGTTMYGVVFTIGLVIWAVVALMGYFREDKK